MWISLCRIAVELYSIWGFGNPAIRQSLWTTCLRIVDSLAIWQKNVICSTAYVQLMYSLSPDSRGESPPPLWYTRGMFNLFTGIIILAVAALLASGVYLIAYIIY